MRKRRDSGRHGFTMVELLVVMSIIVILAALAIPTFANLGVFSGGELRRAAREAYSILRAAQVYAITYRVRTAVIYAPAEEYVRDSVSAVNPQVQVFRAAAMVYQLTSPSLDVSLQGKYVPVPRGDGDFSTFAGGMVIPMLDPDQLTPITNKEDLALKSISVCLDVDFQDPGDPLGLVTQYPAHVFRSDGRLDVGAGTKERYRFLVTFPPDEAPDNRLIYPDEQNLTMPDGALNVVHIPIELYRSTGRVKIAS